VLRAVPGFERVSLFVLHHHEAFDGKGYPAGLRGDEIPIGSRIVSVMDSFDGRWCRRDRIGRACRSMRRSGVWRQISESSSIRL
jgi:HD-GYP domain-containing protein (c-di-GMP phosphodiesterase class II)